MIVSKDKKVIYLANGRTGSTFIHEKAIETMNGGESILMGIHDIDGINYGMKHAPLSVAKLYLRSSVDDFDVYLFIRHPVSKLKSSFGLLSRIADKGMKKINTLEPDQWKKRCEQFFYKRPTIDEYIYDEIMQQNSNKGNLTYLNDTNHWRIMYLKYENFQDSCLKLFDAFGYAAPEINKRINSSRRYYKNLKLKPETLKLIKDFFADDMQRFGYF